MALVVFSLCFLAWLARAGSARIAALQAEHLPWRKALAVGTVFGTKLARGAAVASADAELGQATDLSHESTTDAFRRVENDLVNLLRGHDLKDEAVVGKLVGSLRSRMGVGADGILETLRASFRGGADMRPVLLPISGHSQQVVVPSTVDYNDFVIARYLAHRRGTADVQSIKDMLRVMELAELYDGLFLRCLGQSHRLEEFADDTDAEIMVILEPFIGSLQDMVEEVRLGYTARIELFINLFAVILELHDSGIPHSGDIALDTVLVKGEFSDPDSFRVVLSPSILHCSKDECTDFNADVKRLGKIVRLLLDLTWPEELRLRNHVVLAFAKALETGALTGVETVKKEFSAMMSSVLSASVTDSDLLMVRIKFLQLSMGAVKASEKHPRAAKAQKNDLNTVSVAK